MPRRPRLTNAELRQMLHVTQARCAIGLDSYAQLRNRYRQAEVENDSLTTRLRNENNHLRTEIDSLRSLLSENGIEVPADLSRPGNGGNGSIIQTNQIVSSGTVNNYNTFITNPNPYNPGFDDPRTYSSSVAQDRNQHQNDASSADARPSNARGTCSIEADAPPMPRYRDRCARRRCDGRGCEFVHRIQRAYYKDAIDKLPFKPGN